MSQEKKRSAEEQALLEQSEKRIRKVLKKMPDAVPLVLITSKGVNDEYTQAARQVIETIREIADKVEFREFDLDSEQARKYNVTHAPTLLFDPEWYNIRWIGAPVGQETQVLVETLILLGYKKTALGEESEKILKRIDSPREVKIFVSLSCPYCPQQAVNGVRAAAAKPKTISLSIVDVQVAPDLADKYDAQSVPQTYANDVLVSQGAQQEELFLSSLEKLEPVSVFIPESTEARVECDLVVVGGGPAGLTAGIYGSRSGLRTVVIEKGVLGGQVSLTPVVENYPALNQVGGKALVDMLVTHALEYVQIFPGEEVLDVQPGDPMKITTNRREFTARAVLMATGASYRKLDVPGETRLSGHGVSYCSTCDGPLFRGKKAIVVGGGNGAVTEALHLHHIGVDVTLVHRRDKLRAQEMLAQSLYAVDLPVRWDTVVEEIRGERRVEEVLLRDTGTGEISTMPVDAVFVAIGNIPATELAKKIGIELDSDGYLKSNEHHRTNLQGIYSAGDVEGGYRQIVTAVGQGAEAAMSIYEDLINPYWKQKAQA